MDWQSLLRIGGIVLLVVLMMRGCGGMMSGRGMGGCGMGMNSRPRRREENERAEKPSSRDQEDDDRTGRAA